MLPGMNQWISSGGGSNTTGNFLSRALQAVCSTGSEAAAQSATRIDLAVAWTTADAASATSWVVELPVLSCLNLLATSTARKRCDFYKALQCLDNPPRILQSITRVSRSVSQRTTAASFNAPEDIAGARYAFGDRVRYRAGAQVFTVGEQSDEGNSSRLTSRRRVALADRLALSW
jgi:hypothetical protein